MNPPLFRLLKPQSFILNELWQKPTIFLQELVKFAKYHKNPTGFSKNLPNVLWTNRRFLSSLVDSWIPLIPWSPAAWATPWTAVPPGRCREASGSCRTPSGWRSRCHLHLGNATLDQWIESKQGVGKDDGNFLRGEKLRARNQTLCGMQLEILTQG